jgi:hypothetical protein
MIERNYISPDGFQCPEDTIARVDEADFLGNLPGLARSYAYAGYFGDDPADHPENQRSSFAGGDLNWAEDHGADLSALFLIVDRRAGGWYSTRQTIGCGYATSAYHDGDFTRFHGEDRGAVTYADGHAEAFEGYSGSYNDYWSGDLEGYRLFKRHWKPW